MAMPARPFQVTAAFMPLSVGGTEQAVGVGVRAAAGGQINMLMQYRRVTTPFSYLLTRRATNPTTFSANGLLTEHHHGDGLIWFQWEEDAVNRVWRWSSDGYEFIDLFSEVINVFGTPDRICWGVQQQSATFQAGMTLRSWLVET
jgi:hypothetical protein